MMFDLIIRNGQLVRESGVERADLAVENEKIVEISPTISGPAREEIDATNLHVFPGVIDPHVHFNEPGRTDWEGFETGSAALSAGGGTMFFDMPLNSSPPVLDGESFDLKLAAGLKNSRTDFALWGGLTPDNLDKMEELAERGVMGFKAFMCPSGLDEFHHADPDTLLRGMETAAKLRLPVAVHAEEPGSLERFRAEVVGHSWSDYLKSRPVVCEMAAARIAIECARETGCSLHVVHASSQHVVNSIQFSRDGGAAVTCETCPHYFLLCDEDLPRIGARAKCSPPLRDREDARMLLAQLLRGEIDFVGSDHSPTLPSMKTGDDAFAIWGGIAGVQSTLASLLTIWMDGTYPLRSIAPLIAGNVSRRFDIPSKGIIDARFDADFALVDTNERFTLTRDMLLDRHKLSPYVGRTFHGVVRRTIVRGQTVFADGKIVAKPIGQLIKPEAA